MSFGKDGLPKKGDSMKHGAMTSITTECLHGLLLWKDFITIKSVMQTPKYAIAETVTIITDEIEPRVVTLQAIHEALKLNSTAELVAVLQTPSDILSGCVTLLVRSIKLPEIPEGGLAMYLTMSELRKIIDED